MIGKIRSVVLDCPDPEALATFYADLLGMERVGTEPDWVVIADERGYRVAFQRSGDFRPPAFPDPHGSQQFHLDVQVDDIAVAERRVLALGAKPLLANDDEDFRVYADPAGHPFCLCWDLT